MKSLESKEEVSTKFGSAKHAATMAFNKEEQSVGAAGNERSILYEKGLKFKVQNCITGDIFDKRNASYSHALQCFLGCLQDIKGDMSFPELPHCLRNIGEIYSTLGEFEKAIEFVQAEKLFYETALIQAGRKESDDSLKEGKQTELIDPSASSEEAHLANEYEKLAQMCLKEKKIQLALEYAGKATQLRKKIYGDSHTITAKSLNQFTMIYAEMGKQQYSAAMEKFSEKSDSDNILKDEKSREKYEEISHVEYENRGEKCNSLKDEKGSEERQTEDNSDVQAEQNSTEEPRDKVSSGKIMFFYFVLTLLVTLVLTAVVYHLSDTDIHSIHSYLLQRLKFYYYYYFNSSVHGIRYV